MTRFVHDLDQELMKSNQDGERLREEPTHGGVSLYLLLCISGQMRLHISGVLSE